MCIEINKIQKRKRESKKECPRKSTNSTTFVLVLEREKSIKRYRERTN